MLAKKLLKNRNFYLLMGYQLFAGLADKLFQFCIPWFVYDLTGSATQMVLTFGITMAPYLIFCFLGGTLVDYFNRRVVLLITTALSGVTLLIFSMVMSYDKSFFDLEIVYALCFLLATYNALDIPAFDSSIVDYFAKEELISVNSTLEAILSTCNIVGPLLAGALIALVGGKQAMMSIAFVYIGSFACMLLSKPVRLSSACKKFGSLGEFLYEHGQFIKSGFAYVFTVENPILLGIMISCLSNIVFGSLDVLMAFIARDDLGMQSESFASVMSIGALCSLIFIVFFSYKLRKFHPFTMMIITLLIDAIASVVIGIANAKILILGFYCLTIITASLYNIFGRTFRQSYISPAYMGRVTGISRSLTYSALALGSIFSGMLLEFISVKSYFVVGGLLMGLTTCLSYYLQKRFNPSVFETNACN